MGDLTQILENLPEFGSPYLKESVLDPETGVEIFILTPKNPTLQVKFVSSVQLHTSHGPIQLAFDIAGPTIEDACLNWRAAAQVAVKQAAEQAKAQQQRIVVPGSKPTPTPPFQRKFGLPHA